MAQSAENKFPQWLSYFPRIDSTNNYAMQLVDDGLARHGMVVQAGHQTSGRGQRGNSWQNDAGNVMMSLVVRPVMLAEQQFALSMLVACTIAKYLQNLYQQWQVAIKWPNDIYINDKKACGLLIENIFRGMQWSWAVVGIGLNVNQTNFPADMPNATSLAAASGLRYDLLETVTDLRSGILNAVNLWKPTNFEGLQATYNALLFEKNQIRKFRLRDSGRQFDAAVLEVDADGRLLLLTHTGVQAFQSGMLDWLP
ncbi:MAG: biotin--[acetyl-CoA-carboxylase] ligase [Edaphocola sp.]